MGHELKRVAEERDSDGYYRWRWVCVQGCLGRWNYQSENVAREAFKLHPARVIRHPKAVAPRREFAALQELLSFTYPSARD